MWYEQNNFWLSGFGIYFLHTDWIAAKIAKQRNANSTLTQIVISIDTVSGSTIYGC